MKPRPRIRHPSSHPGVVDGRRWYRIAAAATAVVALAALVLGASGQLDSTTGAPAMTDGLAAQDTGTLTTSGDVLMSQGMPAYASSDQDSQVSPPWDAVDGDPGTRWSSAVGGAQWLEVDLLSIAAIGKVTLDWDPAYATAFTIQTSDNAKTWTTIYATTRGRGGTETLSVSGRGRYVRMHATAAATAYGYSLWEFQVYGQPGPQPMMTPTPPRLRPNLDSGSPSSSARR